MYLIKATVLYYITKMPAKKNPEIQLWINMLKFKHVPNTITHEFIISYNLLNVTM